MTRSEFVEMYAARANIRSGVFAPAGYIVQPSGDVLVALPCGCGEAACPGWGMSNAETILLHLEFSAPEPLRTAYREAVKAMGGE